MYNDSIMQKIIVSIPKPRARHLHEVMRGRAGGRMKSSADFNRNALKRELQRASQDDNRT